MKKRSFRVGPFLPAAAVAAALCVCLIFASLPAMADSPQDLPAAPAAQSIASASSAAASKPALRPLKVSYSTAKAAPAVGSAQAELPQQPELTVSAASSAEVPVQEEVSAREAAADISAAAPPIDAQAQSETASAPDVPDDLVLLDTFIATAYCVTGTTATGTYTTAGRTLAVNPNIIPYGTHVWLYLDDGTLVGDYYAEDTGSNMMQNPYVVDIYMGEGSYNDCILWGAQHVSIYVEAEPS